MTLASISASCCLPRSDSCAFPASKIPRTLLPVSSALRPRVCSCLCVPSPDRPRFGSCLCVPSLDRPRCSCVFPPDRALRPLSFPAHTPVPRTLLLSPALSVPWFVPVSAFPRWTVLGVPGRSETGTKEKKCLGLVCTLLSIVGSGLVEGTTLVL